MAKEEQYREIWIDDIKVIACVLVVLGHFFQSMTRSGILPSNNLYRWFNQTIYYFHVPLFFICSGYLYQKWSYVDNICCWRRNVRKKAITLGVPYFVFTIATWIPKCFFPDVVNTENSGLFDTLFLHPMSPYWYLYALFFLFLVTPTFSNKRMAVIGLTVALMLKIYWIIGEAEISAISYILENEIWFVAGMCLNADLFKRIAGKVRIAVPIAAGILFLSLSVLVYIMEIQSDMAGFLLGLLACFSLVLFIVAACKDGKQNAVFKSLAQYTMPIFVMHTLSAAPFRILLLKAGIRSVAVHVVLGLVVSFGGPIMFAKAVKRIKWIDFCLYPRKYVKV